MAVSYKGLVIKFGGDTTELQGALKKIQSESRNTQADLRDINKALKFDPGNTELLQQKVRALNAAYEDTKSKLDAYKQALAQLESKKQSGAQLTEQEQRQYDSLKRSIMQCERQLESYQDDLSKTANEAKASESGLYKFGQTVQDNADKLSSAGSKMEKAGTAIAGGVAAAAGGLSALAESQHEAIAQNAQLNTAFETNGGTVEQASQVYANFYRIIGEDDTATEASQNLIRLTNSQKELDAWTDIAAGAYATFGDALPLENLAEAAQETAHTATVTGGFADALNWSTASTETWSQALSGHASAQDAFNAALAEGGTKEDAFNAALAACGDEQERASLITETLTALYGDAGKQYQETNADLLGARDAQNEMNQSMRELGEAALPVQQAVSEIGSGLLNELAPALESVTGWYKSLSPENQELVKNLGLGALAFGGVTTAVGKTLQKGMEIGGTFKDVATGFSELSGKLADSGALTAVKDGFGTLLTKGKGVAGMLTGALSSGWSSFTGLIAANPILLGVVAVAAAVAGLTWFFTQTETGKQLWSDFTGWISEKWQAVQDFFAGVPEFWGSIWDGITTGAQGLVDSLGEKWESLKTAASETWENVKTGASEAWGNVKTTVGDLAQGATSAASGAWETLKGGTATAFENIKGNIQTDMDTARSVAGAASSGLQAALNGDWETAKQQAANAFQAVRDNIDSKMDNARAQAVNIADRIGDKLGFPGLGSKVGGVFDGVRSAIENPVRSAWDFISGIPGKIMDAFSGIRISLPRIKLPHFEVSWRDIGGVVSLPSIGVSWYARGGYFDQPSLIGVGEAGGEFVAPERQLRSFIESAVNRAFAGTGAPQQSVTVNVSVSATVADGADAYETGRQIGTGIASRLKQRGVSIVVA